MGLAEELEWQENLERDGQEGGMKRLSNCWQASTWHMNLKAIRLCCSVLSLVNFSGYTQHTRKKKKKQRERWSICSCSFLSCWSQAPPSIPMTLAHTLITHTWWVGQWVRSQRSLSCCDTSYILLPTPLDVCFGPSVCL